MYRYASLSTVPISAILNYRGNFFLDAPLINAGKISISAQSTK